MIDLSFSCFSGVSPEAERKLWSRGCHAWRDLLLLDRPIFSEARHRDLRGQIRQAEVALRAGLWDYFIHRFAPADRIRLLPHPAEGVTYLDIETTGLRRDDVITSIGMLRDGELRCFVRGINLDDFLAEIPRISLLVTFNGARFDLPRLRACFDVDLAVPHVDLLPCMAGLGYRGGLKVIEQSLGMARPDGSPASGAEAVALWERYRSSRDEQALGMLLRYNLMDVVSLERLAVVAYNGVATGHPLRPRLPTPAHRAVEDLELDDVL